MTEDERPQILPVDIEREVLLGILTDAVSPAALSAALDATNDWAVVIGMAVSAAIRRLRVMSARQLAVLLADEANRHAAWVIEEPPRYSAEEIADVS